ncbi:MAG: hypothetical protein LLG00_01050 [Planctomycetaceae bacterium]|nr:hypothetical protein [Planctomycetaceae bacterium]
MTTPPQAGGLPNAAFAVRKATIQANGRSRGHVSGTGNDGGPDKPPPLAVGVVADDGLPLVSARHTRCNAPADSIRNGLAMR